MDQLVCFWGASASVYKGAQEEEARPRGGVLLPPVVGLLLFLFGEGEGRKRKDGGRKGGAGPPPNSDWAWGGRPLPCSFPLLSTKAH